MLKLYTVCVPWKVNLHHNQRLEVVLRYLNARQNTLDVSEHFLSEKKFTIDAQCTRSMIPPIKEDSRKKRFIKQPDLFPIVNYRRFF